MTAQLVKVTKAHQWDAYHHIRQLVLYKLRGRAGYDPEHPDEYRKGRIPLLFLQNGTPVGTVRLETRAAPDDDQVRRTVVYSFIASISISSAKSGPRP
jgi:hypothetical protein